MTRGANVSLPLTVLSLEERKSVAKSVMPIVRVLVVDDFEPIHRVICAELGKRHDLHVICEVSDGLDAVQKAGELKPDLILMDIGLRR